MNFAYADPPYLESAGKYKDEHPEALKWLDPDTHRYLIDELIHNYPEGWVLSTSSQSLQTLLPMCPPTIRVMAWVKPFAAFKRNVNPAYAWEPVLMFGGRPRTDEMTYMRDWAAESITLKKGLTGAKPRNLCYWIFDALNARPGDTLDDLFPGTGVVGEAWNTYINEWPEWASRLNRVTYRWEMGKGIKR